MKMISVLVCAAFVMAVSFTGMSAEKAEAKKGKVLRHVVAFKFKDTASKDDIKKVEEAFRDLKKKIPQIKDYEWGLNNSPEKHNKGCTHAFILTFNSEKDRDDYLVHEEHKKFGGMVGPVLAEVFVIDFWAQE
jgi:hypothetical protein